MAPPFRTVAALCGLLIVASVTSFPAAQDRASDFRLSGVRLREVVDGGEPAFELAMPSSAYQDPARERLTDRAFMAWLPADFQDGVIEVDLVGDLAPDAPAYARGFVGVSFRIDASGAFENIYLRPTNGAADDQVRRNHTIQYFAHPEHPFDRLRTEAPERYETYADIAPGRWTRMKIVVTNAKARLYLDDRQAPAFLVNDLKLGPGQRGGVGIWIESGTVARFRNLRVTPAKAKETPP